MHMHTHPENISLPGQMIYIISMDRQFNSTKWIALQVLTRETKDLHDHVQDEP